MTPSPKILIVESDQKLSADIAGTLKVEGGWEVIFARDAVVALTIARQHKPALILLDAQLPGGGGIMVLQRLRTLMATADTPVIVITEAEENLRQKVMSSGAQECLDKPLNPKMMIAAVKRHIGHPLSVMEAPAHVIRDPQRLTALRQTGLLDSKPEEIYDLFTQMASKLLGVPAALVSLVDDNRQFFKSQVGLKEPWATSRQTPLTHSFCQWAVATNEPLVVDDAREHQLLRNNLACRDLAVVAYAGIPICNPEGQAIGSFCAIDIKPRAWSERDLTILKGLTQALNGYIDLQLSLRPS